MRRQLPILILIFIAAFATAAQKPVAVTGTNVLKKELQLKLDEWHKAGKFPGATLGVVLPDGEVIALAVGYSDRDAKTPMKPTDRMLAGSTGKTFAAAMAMQMVKNGQLNLDDKIEKFFGKEPWFARISNAKDITVRQLMNHTSGLVRYEFKKEFTDFLTANPYKVWTPEDRLAYLFDAPAPFEAGKGWEYSDTNYIVLGMILEKITGKQYYDEADRRFIKRFKLRNTIPQTGPELKGVVQGYAGPSNPFGGKDAMIENGKFIVNPQLEWTGGGWASTGEDLARWAKLMYEGKAFDESMVALMLDGVPAKLGPNVKYGLGVIIRPTAAGLTYGHSGFFPGYMTDMMYFPEKKVAIAVQVNSSAPQIFGGKPPARLIAELAAIVSPSEAAAAKRDDAPTREVAITFDDLPASHGDLTRMRESNEKLLHTIRANKIPAIGFVNESKLAVEGETEARTALLKMWVDAGLDLGNHSYSHIQIDNATLKQYQDDVVRGETVTRHLLSAKNRQLRYYRHTQLRTGPTAAYREGLNKFLAERGYTIAPVTIDNQEWVFAGAYAGAKQRRDEAEMKRIGEAYVRYMDETFGFFEKLSRDFLGYEVKQTLLLHVNDLNADYFDELVEMMKNRGYTFVSLDEALKDKAYALPEAQSARGLSWLHRWMLAKGLPIREEPREPRWIGELHSSYMRARQDD